MADQAVRVLIVDDDPNLCKTLSDILTIKGFRPKSFSQGKPAIAWAEQEAPVVALIDLRLEDLPGLEVMHAVKAVSPRTECIVLTGHASQASAIEAINLGAYSYVQKPCNVDQLLVTIRRAVEKQEAAEALRESEQRFRLLYEQSPLPFHSLDAEGRLLEVNAAWLAELGYERSEVIGRWFGDFLASDGPALFLERLAQFGAPGEIHGVEYDMKCKDGTTILVSFDARIAYDEKGRFMQALGVFTNITERKRAEEETRRHVARLEALRQVSLELATELDLDALLRSIVERATALVGGRWGSFEIYRSDLDALVSTAMYGAGPDLSGIPLRRGEGLGGKIWESGQPLIVDDYQDWQGRAAAYEGHPSRAMVGVPVRWGDEFLGVLNIEAGTAGAFAPDDAELLGLFAGQAAVAIHNARLYQEAEQRLRELSQLFETSAALSTSLDKERVLRTIAQHVTAALGTEGCAISSWDGTRDALITLLDYASDPDHLKTVLPGTLYPLAQYPDSRQVLSSRQPHAVRVSDPKADRAEVQLMIENGVLSLLMLPLVIGDRVIGLLELVEGRQERTFTPAEIGLCQTLANQAAAALENALLYDEAQRRNRELTLLNRIIAASAAGQTLEPFLETVCRELATCFDVPQSVATLFDAAKTRDLIVAECAAPGRPSGLGDSFPMADNPASQHLLTEKTPLVIDDAQTDPRWGPVRDLMRRRGTISLLLLPLIVDGDVVGSLGIDAVERRVFSADEVALAQRVAEQVGGALARARLEEAQQRLSTAVEQSPNSVLITDTKGTILYTNPAFERTTGYRREEALGQNPRLLKSGKHGAAFYGDLWRTISSGQVWQGRLVNRKKDGSLYTEDATITPVRNPAGETVHYVSTTRDVTRELLLEEQFHQAQKLEAVGRLAGGVAHDFNNLLTVVQLSARLLERKLLAEDPLLRHVKRIQEAGVLAANLTKQLLAFSRREIVEPKVVDLNQVVGHLEEMLRHLIGEDIDLTLRPGEELWPVRIDPTQVEQVVVNLAVNARDAMPTGGKLAFETANAVLDEAYAATHLEVEPGEYVLLTASDSGTGMNDEVKARLFEPFFTTKEQGRGTGLGLATVFGIVKQNGGHIWVYSEVGQGTAFKIYLPRTADVAVSRPAPSRPPQAAARPGTETLLLVEDEPLVRELTRDILLGQGYRVLTAGDGVEALRLAEAHHGPIHLLLTDVVMPRMSGRELADKLRRGRPETRVLFTSGYTDDAVVRHGVLAEGIHFLSKPFEMEALARKVREVLDADE